MFPVHCIMMNKRKRWIPKFHAILSTALALAIALAVSLSIAAVIKLIQNDSDRWRVGQVLFMRLDKKVYQLNALEWETDSDPSLLQSNSFQFEALNLDAGRSLGALRRLRGDTGPLPAVGQALARYQAAISAELALTRDGQAMNARTMHRDQVLPAFVSLTNTVRDAGEEYDSQAVAAGRLADIGTTTVLVATALLLALLARRIVRVRQQGTQLATERETLRQSEQRFQALIRNASDVIAIVSPDGALQYLSSAARPLWGYEAEILEGTLVPALVHPADAARLQALLAQVCAGEEGSQTAELRLRHADGSWHLCEVLLTNLLSEPGIEGIVLTCRNIEERKAFEEQLAHQAFHDALTGLPNRALFMERLGHAQARACRSLSSVGIIFLDLDNFKVVNDSLGHEAGDRLLTTVAERLTACVRPGDTVARLGGDEFTVLLEDMDEARDGEQPLLALADRIVQALNSPVLVSGREVFTTGSVGIAAAFGDERTPDDLLRDADTAMYQAKSHGKSRSVVFDRSMNADAVERLELETDLRRALEKEEFRVYYQPIIHLETGRIVEVEALVRWEHPERGLIPPLKFIPLAEETGLIVALGRWVLAEACRQAREWHRQFPEEPPLILSVNLSARQLQQPALVAEVVEILKETGLHPSLLKLEITESVMMLDSATTIPRLHQLKELGVHLAVDDFGTGYSSMSYLSSLPIDTLKIDRAFVSNMERSADDLAIVRAIVSLAKTLNLRITTEGIETSAQLSQLQALGCDQGQGYHFDRPMTTAQLSARLAQRRPAVPAG